MTPTELLLAYAHLLEVEASPSAGRDVYVYEEYGITVRESDACPRPTLAVIMACGAERREALRRARALGATGADKRRVSKWFAGGTARERRARERAT